MVSTTECRLCGRNAGKGAFACDTCTQTARTDLQTIAGLAGHLDGKRARRRSNWTTGTIGRSTATPLLPYDPRVSKVADPILVALHGTARIVGDATSSWPPDDSLAGTARWLVHRCEWLRVREVGPEEFGSFETAKDALVALFDNPPTRLWMGRCGSVGPSGTCATALYVEADDEGKPDAASVTCPTCGAVHWVITRQKELAAGVADYLGTSAQISALCRHIHGADVSTAAIRGYAFRGTITAQGTRTVETSAGPRDADLWRIGDVMDAAAATQAKRDLYHSVRR